LVEARRLLFASWGASAPQQRASGAAPQILTDIQSPSPLSVGTSDEHPLPMSVMRCHFFLLLMTPCLITCLASCGGTKQQARGSAPAPMPAATASTSVESELYHRALNESDLAVQVDLLVDSLRLGSVDAGARLIALGRWNEMALVDPRQPPLASWAGAPERVGALTRGQVYGVLLANWAIRNAKAFEGAKPEAGNFDPQRREMVRALKEMWDGPLDDRMLLGELYWLISKYSDAGQKAEEFRWWMLPRFLDGAETLDRPALHARLVQFIYLVSKDSGPEKVYESAYDKAVTLARANGLIGVELTLSSWRPFEVNPGGQPPVNRMVFLPDELARMIGHTQSLLDLSRRTGDDLYVSKVLSTLAWMRHPDRLRFDVAPAYPTASWQEVAKLYAEEGEAALASRVSQGTAQPFDLKRVRLEGENSLPASVVHAYALINQAWCLHQGIARNPQGVPQAIALYEKAIAQLDAAFRNGQVPVRISSPGAAPTLRWLRDELTPNQFVESMYDGIKVPDAEIFPQTYIHVQGMRVGPYVDYGIGEERGWWDEKMERRAVSGSWKDGRRDGAWTWWHADGSVAVTGSFRAGIQIGRWRFLKPDGTPFLELDAGDGLFTGEVPLHEPDGTTRPGTRWKDGREILPDVPPTTPPPPRNGREILLYPDGRKRAAGVFADGLETGEWTWWHEDGVTVKERAHMRMGIRDGEVSIWGESGALEYTGTWRCGLHDGDWTTFDYSGKKLYIVTYRMGEKMGEREK
jgi:antitoxin component YwqK of YwqJK toxin-antitoxin module